MNYCTFNKIMQMFQFINVTLLKVLKINTKGLPFEAMKTMGNKFLKLRKPKGTFL